MGFLTLWEVSAWCHEASNGSNGFLDWHPAQVWCPARDGGNFYLSWIWYLPLGYAFVIELITVMYIIREFVYQLHFGCGDLCPFTRGLDGFFIWDRLDFFKVCLCPGL